MGRNRKNYDIRLKCKNCKDYTKTISPIRINKFDTKSYQISGICVICNKMKTKKANEEQVSILPDEIKNSPAGSKFVDNFVRDGGIIPLPIIIGAILAGITAVTGVAGTVASNVIQAKKNDAEIELAKQTLSGKGLASEEDKLAKYVNKIEGMGFRIYKL